MDNQHRSIKGYRELTQLEIDLMNEIKTKGQELEALSQKVFDHIQCQMQSANELGLQEEITRLDEANPLIWFYDGASSLQKGLMFLTRSVAQPTSF